MKCCTADRSKLTHLGDRCHVHPRGGGCHDARRLFLVPHPLVDEGIDPRTHELHKPEIRSLPPALQAGGESVYRIGFAVFFL